MCKEQGIELRLTAPYSPPQNAWPTNDEHYRVSWANLMAREYLNISGNMRYLTQHMLETGHTKPMGTLTPYQGWFKTNPIISHLREFGAPVDLLYRDKRSNADVTKIKKAHLCWIRWMGSNSSNIINAEKQEGTNLPKL